MFVTKRITLVENGILNDENIRDITDGFEKEVYYNKKYVYFTQPYNIIPEYNLTLYNDIRKILSEKQVTTVTDDRIDNIMSSILKYESINPTLEILELIKNLPINTPQNCSIIQVLYNNIVMGSISVTVDSRLTLFNKKVAYIVGIPEERKSAVLFAIQSLLPNSIFKQLILSDLLIKEINKYGLELNAKYIVVTPISKMQKILEKYHGFKREINNIMQVKYKPPCFLMEAEYESIHWKKIKKIKNINDLD